MARSTGEAIAIGLDAGYGRAMDYAARKQQQERQAKLDEQNAVSMADSRRRQAGQDELAALNAQEQLLKEEGVGLAAAATPPDEAVQRDFAGRTTKLRTARHQALSRMSGYDLSAQKKAGAADLKALQEGDGDLAKLQPGQLLRATTVGTGRHPSEFVRPQGGMAPVEKAGMNVLEGLQAGDMGRVISGLNVIHAPELRKGVGQPGREGGNIVAKQIISVVPDPRNKDPENPRVIPVMRIYVSGGEKFNGPLPPGVPEGATGYYDAPLTENRSSDPDDPVKSIGMEEAMNYIGKQLELVELMNSPQALAKQREDEAAGAWDPNEYLSALTSLGATPKKQLTTQRTVIPQGSEVLETVTDPTGKVVTERRVQGPAKVAPGGLEQFKANLDDAVAKGILNEEEANQKYRTALDAAARGGGKGSAAAARETPASQAERLVAEGKFKTLAEARAFVTPSKAANEAAARARDLSGLKSGGLGGAAAPDKPDEAVEFWAQAVIAGDKDWQVGLSRSKTGGDLIEKVKRRVPQLAKQLGLEPQDIGTTRAQAAAYAAAMKDLTKRSEGVELFASKVEKDMQTFDGLLDSAAGTSPLALNRPINTLRREFTTDGEIQALDLAASQVGKEYQRIIDGGTLSAAQLHVGAAEDAKKMINGDMTPRQARAVMAAMRQEMQNAREAARESTTRIQEKMRGLGRGAEPKKDDAPAGAAPSKTKSGATSTNW